MLGKTFKGLTDELLAWQTARLLELEARRTASTVYVRPELVVEIAFDGIQTSSRYPGGVALRFARVIRYRPDKRADEADTIATVPGACTRRAAGSQAGSPAGEASQLAGGDGSTPSIVRRRSPAPRDALAEVDPGERDGDDREERAQHDRDREQLQRRRDRVGEVRDMSSMPISR